MLVSFSITISPSANPYRDTLTLWQGYPQFGSSTAGRVDALGGRQVLRFGDERVIGPSDWLNVGRTFDVARVDLHHPGYKVSVFASSVVPGDSTDLHNVLPGNNLYGVYGSFQNIVRKANFEPYVLWRVAPANSGLPEDGRTAATSTKSPSAFTGKANYRRILTMTPSLMGRPGLSAHTPIRRVGRLCHVGKAFPNVVAAPLDFIEGNYASGTKNPAGRDWNTFDQLYPSNHDKYGFADLVGRRNLVQFRVGVEENLGKKWKIKQAFEGYWLATSNDNFYASSGAIAVARPPRP